MSSKLLAALAATALFFLPSSLPAQQPAPQPIQSMPYSPSLDVTSLDRSVDPCVDFYKFSCGGWQKNNPIPADQAGWSVYAKLGNENQQFLWGILRGRCEGEEPHAGAAEGGRLLCRVHEHDGDRCAGYEAGAAGAGADRCAEDAAGACCCDQPRCIMTIPAASSSARAPGRMRWTRR